uniref:Uncharacterized protein LOC102807516 n=1 Tax=Saccoglossus kowalevskii TaxID=10224 RepID=A0ABM0MZL0_SACKO|nr:PREDICTED: uncharacterized protein LOC102807516 [Saccoglossus kowalevskii]
MLHSAAHPRIPDHCMDLSQEIDDRSVNKNSEQLNTKKRGGKLLSQSAEDPLMTETSHGSQDLGTLDDNETRQRRSGVEIDASNVTSNGVERLPFNLSDVPSDEFNSFTLSGLDEEDTGKAWYENSDEEDSMEPTPRPVVRKTANTNRGKSTSKDKTNKHIYFL